MYDTTAVRSSGFQAIIIFSKMVYHHIGVGMFVSPLIKHFKTDGPVPSPPRSPDITMMCSFSEVMWKISCIKQRFSDYFHFSIYFKQRISDAIATIDEATEIFFSWAKNNVNINMHVFGLRGPIWKYFKGPQSTLVAKGALVNPNC